MKRTVGYTRVSTDGQLDGVGLDTQRERIEAYCTSQGWMLDSLYTDGGYSGAKLNRPALDDLRAAIDAGEIGRIVVYKLDRLSRRLLHLKELVDDELTPAGIVLASVTEPIDTATPAGRLFFNMLGSFAEFEREVITERLDGGRRTRTRQGGKASGPIPYGYTRTAAGDIAQDPDTGANVARIFAAYLSAGSLSKLQAELDAAGITGPNGEAWSRAALAYLLKNRFYLGKAVYGDVEAQGKHKALVSASMFGKVQAALDRGNKRKAA